jgi:hypothetical protein
MTSSEVCAFDDMQVTIRMRGKTAFGLRHMLPVVVQIFEGSDLPGAAETTEALREAVVAMDLALPSEIRAAVDEAAIAEKRMDVVDKQRAASDD